MKNKYKLFKKYIIKNSEGIHVVKSDFFESICSWPQALSLGVSCYCEIQRVLSDDALDEQDSYVGNMKVTTGLERSLQELSHRYPGLMEEIHYLPISCDGARVYRC